MPRTHLNASLCCLASLPLLAAAQPPRPDHVVIVIEENKAYTQIIGSASAPYINSLAAAGALMTQSYGITHPSQPNYIAFWAGSTLGITTNNFYPHEQFIQPNLGAKILSAGFTFGGYSETLPDVGSDVESAGDATIGYYKRKHNPWVNWQDDTIPRPTNKVPSSVNMPYTMFPTDYATLPALSVVVPNQLHDMHDGTIQQGDTWLQQNIEAYAAWAMTHNSLLIVTFDEDDSAHANRVATIFYGPMIIPGTYSQTINHYNMLRTLEDMFGLGHDAGSINALPIAGIWAAPSCEANCDSSTFAPVLNANDFACFLNLFAAADARANCDGSTTAPVLNALDFSCFLSAFAAGCT